VVVIEHNLDVITAADWILDLGPGGGKYGGELLFAGTPKAFLKSDVESATREALHKHLDNN
jgi:excinuclease UvrABC ATPase subunit